MFVRLMRFQEIVDGIVVKVSPTIDEILSNDVISGVIQVLEQNARASISSKKRCPVLMMCFQLAALHA